MKLANINQYEKDIQVLKDTNRDTKNYTVMRNIAEGMEEFLQEGKQFSDMNGETVGKIYADSGYTKLSDYDQSNVDKMLAAYWVHSKDYAKWFIGQKDNDAFVKVGVALSYVKLHDDAKEVKKEVVKEFMMSDLPQFAKDKLCSGIRNKEKTEVLSSSR